MPNHKKHIKEELEDLKALELSKYNKPSLKIPLELKQQLLDKVETNDADTNSALDKVVKFILPLGVAATLIIGFFIWFPKETQEELSMEMLSDQELEMWVYEYIDDYDDVDLLALASEDAGLFDFSSIDEEYFEDEILANDDFSYDDLF
ncbi:MAG: hypothetical protein ACI9O4_002219 [Chitinophagales bacterium]|jgi:hypothetical protein